VSGDFGQVRDRVQNVHNTNHQSPITNHQSPITSWPYAPATFGILPAPPVLSV